MTKSWPVARKASYCHLSFVICIPDRSPVFYHKQQFSDQGIDLLQVFSAAFFRFQLEGPAKGEHIPEIADFAGGEFWILRLLKDRFPDLVEVRLDPASVSSQTFPKELPQEVKLLGDRLHG